MSTRYHGAFDYSLGGVLLILPWLRDLEITGIAAWSLLAAAVALLANALGTNFEMGALRIIPIPLHLWIDGVLGLLLAVSPWVLGFDRIAWIPHLAAGVALMAVAFLTETIPGYERRGSVGRETA